MQNNRECVNFDDMTEKSIQVSLTSFICQICQKPYARLSHLSTHVHQVHHHTYQEYYDLYLKLENEGLCKICGKVTEFYKGKYAQYCSRTCQNNDPVTKIKNSEAVKAAKQQFTPEQIEESNRKRQQTCLEVYGTNNVSQLDETKEKVKQSFHDHYGDWYVNTDECKKAFVDKYGVDNALQSPEILDRVHQTCIERYGSATPAKNEEVKAKISHTKTNQTYAKFLKFANIQPLFDIDTYTGRKHHQMYPWKCTKCQHIFEYKYQNGLIPICPQCYPPRKQTEYQIYEFLQSIYTETIVRNNRTTLKTELDFYFPFKKLAIEFNGLYWHSEISGQKDKQYHLTKTQLANAQDIQLIHIFEDEWIFKNKIVKNRIKHLLGLNKRKIYARKCNIKEIDTPIKNAFLNKYHIQGEDKANINLGAYYRNHLVAVMTFGKQRIALGQEHIENHWELSRFCTIGTFNVVGIGDKLLKFFERQYKPLQIITYADKRWSMGNFYYKLNFKLDHISAPNYWYIPYGGKYRYHRFNFRKNVLSSKLEIFDDELTEWQNMQLNQYDRVWDCGNLVFIKNYLPITTT